MKPHFFGTYLNIAANVLFWALLSGVFNREGYVDVASCLLAACGASLAWGLARRQFYFVAYAAVYGYVGVSSILVRDINSSTAILSYFVFTGVAMLVMLVVRSRAVSGGKRETLQHFRPRSFARARSAERLGGRGFSHRSAVQRHGTGNRL